MVEIVQNHEKKQSNQATEILKQSQTVKRCQEHSKTAKYGQKHPITINIVINDQKLS